MKDAFVPEDFDVPDSMVGPGFRLEPLGAEHNERDHAAWMSSIDHIRSTPGFDSSDSSWPIAMPLERNLQDLIAHARDFEERTGFTYSALDSGDVIGCVYIYPSRRPGHDAEVKSWVRANRAEMDTVLWESVSDWLKGAWPFTNVYYASRS